MHKITKGLKKKKKGKKSKHKEDELFKPEELEAYRREHQEAAENTAGTAAENEEWKKFKALTSGVDDILKKTQGDLDRIKSTSFFQRVVPPSELKKEQEKREVAQKAEIVVEQKKELSVTEAAIVEVSDSESEDEDEDDIFDTTYIDALAAAEVKLAYIPESPTGQLDGDDPFDTSYAEKAILGPAADKTGKKLVPIGSAVEILTGRVQAPTCSSIARPASNRRQILKERDLLLESFDVPSRPLQETVLETAQPSLLDDHAPSELSNEPIDLSKSLAPIEATSYTSQSSENQTIDILQEFDVIGHSHAVEEEDEDDKEFALLAAESVSKAPSTLANPIQPSSGSNSQSTWNAFGEEKSETSNVDVEVDPFDTTFAENILPGQAELKLIEREILNSTDDFDFNPRAEETYSELIRSKVQIQLINPSGQRESISSLVSEDDLNIIKPAHRDLLGGSTTDLSNLGDKPLQPKENDIDDDYIEYADPFDTSVVDTATLPGQTELKFLERELLGEINKVQLSDDEDFDPRASEEREISVEEVISQRKVSFDLPLAGNKVDLFSVLEEESKVSQPLTPYYARDKSIPTDVDPFDTSFVGNPAPSTTELRLIENELFEEKAFGATTKVTKSEDLLEIRSEIAAKVLTPVTESFEEESGAEVDPFDTSIAGNLLPGKTELRLLESELINNGFVEQEQDFDPFDTSITNAVRLY